VAEIEAVVAGILARADQILLRNGAMSVATISMRHGLDPEQEQQLTGH
jgi:hypothetical protein